LLFEQRHRFAALWADDISQGKSREDKSALYQVDNGLASFTPLLRLLHEGRWHRHHSLFEQARTRPCSPRLSVPV
jgi:hypothetical protein